jgi:hypothetical protein
VFDYAASFDVFGLLRNISFSSTFSIFCFLVIDAVNSTVTGLSVLYKRLGVGFEGFSILA